MTGKRTNRPNRWTGPSSTWRTYTEEERMVAASLDKLRSQDLSIHLYNAHSLKSRVRPDRKGKGKPNSNEESDFVPPDIWTAWPMPVGEVPMDAYLPSTGGEGSWRMAEDMRPSANLEEELLATTTRIARERWRARKWEWVTGKEEGVVKMEEIVKDFVLEQPEIAEDEDMPPDRPMFSSQAPEALGNMSSSSEEEDEATADSESENDIEHRPIPLVDDDQARQVLLPSIRHIISKADDLLEGLHKARKAYAENWNKSKSSVPTTGDETDMDTQASRSRARSKNKQPRKRASTSSVRSEASMKSTLSTVPRGRTKPKMKQLKLRDWSDVLGMAALTGWDPEVVQRAAERCSRLFGEDMLFRTFEEGRKGEKSDFAEHLASGSKSQDPEDQEIVEENEEKPSRPAQSHDSISTSPPSTDSAIRCPVKSCPRHDKLYARARNMYDHVRKRHPEVDILELKKLESRKRGDRRGRWDRKTGQRSSSAASMSSL